MSSMASLTPPVSSPAPQPSADDSANSSPLCRAPGKKANFDQLLDSHLDSKDEQKDVSPAKKRADEKPADPWSLLGVVPGVPPVIPQPPVEQNSDLAGSGKSAAELKTEPGAIPPATSDLPGAPPPGLNPANSSAGVLLPLLEQKTPTADPKEAKAAEQIAGEPEDPAAKSDGITAAKQPTMLLTKAISDEKKGGDASAGEQKQSLSIDQFEAARFEQKIERSKESASKSDSAASLGHESQDSRESRVERVQRVEFASLDVYFHFHQSQSMERPSEMDVKASTPVDVSATIDAIRDHVQILRSSGRDQLNVVLRPDGETQLLLHVVKVDGQIQVQARCERGDFARLDSHWGAIQSSLSAQGIRVESLQPSSSFGQDSSSNSFGQQNGFSPRQDQPPGFDFHEQDSAPSAASKRGEGQPRASAAKQELAVRASSRGWQSWA